MPDGQNSVVFLDQNYKNDCFWPKNNVFLAENENIHILWSDHHANPTDLGRVFGHGKQNMEKTLFWRISAKKSTRWLRITKNNRLIGQLSPENRHLVASVGERFHGRLNPSED